MGSCPVFFFLLQFLHGASTLTGGRECHLSNFIPLSVFTNYLHLLHDIRSVDTGCVSVHACTAGRILTDLTTIC